MKKMKYNIILASIFLLTAFNCNTTEPPVDNLQPGRRDYTWTIDTINTPYDAIGRMWGSSPTDLWTTSDGSWDQSISHFDGENWSSFEVQGIIVPWAVYGFSNNEIYIGAENGKIWKYNGNSWTLFAELTKDGHTDLHFENIWGESPNDLYAFGAYPDESSAFNKRDSPLQ